ncbi:unnamed protein product [Adineta ricciae]|uniref:MORN repeat-containing protein 3 n=1 Tax=Adineta ricciae TaxID=249248 RepID=A0A815XN16_ADIRI|nr:unnamed protein product [Adineta ricciae]
MQRYYVGQWENDQMNGYGTLYFSETRYYEGEFYRNQRCGWGRMHYDNGDVYEGDWFNNQRHGSGRLLTIRGDCYNGHWFEDKKHGYGQYYFKKQNRMCTGLWSDDFCKSSECTQLLNKEHHTFASEKSMTTSALEKSSSIRH